MNGLMAVNVFLLLATTAHAVHVHHHRNRPVDHAAVQLNEQGQFIGTVLWDTFDVMTFGAFESKNNKKPPPKNKTAPSNNT